MSILKYKGLDFNKSAYDEYDYFIRKLISKYNPAFKNSNDIPKELIVYINTLITNNKNKDQFVASIYDILKDCSSSIAHELYSYLDDKHRQHVYTAAEDPKPQYVPNQRNHLKRPRPELDGTKPLFIDEGDELKHSRANLEELHQVKCKYFPKCVYGGKCKYYHPKVDCKYGSQCLRPNCSYSHPDGYAPDSHSNPLLNKLFKTQLSKRPSEPKVYESNPEEAEANLNLPEVDYGENFQPESLFEDNEITEQPRGQTLGMPIRTEDEQSHQGMAEPTQEESMHQMNHMNGEHQEEVVISSQNRDEENLYNDELNKA